MLRLKMILIALCTIGVLAATPSLKKQEEAKRSLSVPKAGKPEMVLVKAGSFTREISAGWFEDAVEQKVMITKDFYIARYEVTQAEYEALMGVNLLEFAQCGGTCPVEMVTWYNAITYANKLSDRDIHALLQRRVAENTLGEDLHRLSFTDRGRVGVRSSGGGVTCVCGVA